MAGFSAGLISPGTLNAGFATDKYLPATKHKTGQNLEKVSS
jgi:hypothetical protein